MTEVLLLTEQDVRGLVSLPDAIEAVEGAFRALAAGDAQMPPKIYLQFPQVPGDLRVMPASIGVDHAGVKIVNSHPRNPEKGLPAVVGTYLLVSQETGLPLAIMAASYLTALRTGAASAVATRLLARPGASTLGLVGSGAQARFQLEAIASVTGIQRAFVWAPKQAEELRDAFIKEMSPRFPGIKITTARSIEEAASCDVVCTTTPSRTPIVPDSAVSPGAHINAVGADGPGKQELDPAILRRAQRDSRRTLPSPPRRRNKRPPSLRPNLPQRCSRLPRRSDNRRHPPPKRPRPNHHLRLHRPGHRRHSPCRSHLPPSLRKEIRHSNPSVTPPTPIQRSGGAPPPGGGRAG